VSTLRLRGTRLVGTGVDDDLAPAAALRLTRAPSVEHGGRIPPERGRHVAADAKPVHLKNTSAHQCRCDRVPNDGDADQRRSIEDGIVEAPGDGDATMRMVQTDEPSHRIGGDRLEPELPVEDEAAATIIGNAPQLLSADLFDADRPDEVACPFRIVVHVPNDLFVKLFAAGMQHEFVPPDLEDFRVFGLTAEEAGKHIG